MNSAAGPKSCNY